MNKKLVNIFLISIIVLHLVFVLISVLDKPFQGDEVNFIHTTEAIKENGNPSAYYSLAHPIYEGNSQPLTYYYLLAISTSILGDSLIGWRIISVIFNVGVVLLVYFMSLYLLGNKNQGWALFAAALYALNPLAIQSSVTLDIDGGLLNFFTLLFVFLFVKGKSPLFLIPAFFLVWHSKITGAAVLFASFVVYFIFTKREDKFDSLKKVGFSVISGSVLFLSTFGFYSAFYGIRFLAPFEHGNAGGLISAFIASPFAVIARSIWSTKLFVYFAIPFFVLLFLSLLFVFIKKKYHLKNDKMFFVGLVAFMTILIFFVYGATGFNFPKYYAPALPLMAIFIAFMFKELKFKIDKPYLRYGILFAVLAIYSAFFLGDPIIPEISSAISSLEISGAILALLKNFLLYVVVPLVLGFVVLYKFKVKNKLFVILLLLTLFFYLYINVIQAGADYSTHQLYGISGDQEMIAYFEENNIPSSSVTTYPNIGYYLGKNDYYDLTFVYNDLERFNEVVVKNDKVQYIVMLDRDFDRIGRDNLESFEEIERFGDYFVLKRI